MEFPNEQMHDEIRLSANEALHLFSIALRQDSRGPSGNWAGAGSGSSIDFHDHRPYVPGDDPRHINWNVYARNETYTMKLYREEVQPHLDLVFDNSRSMIIDHDKASRSLELYYFFRELAHKDGLSLRCHYFRQPQGVHEEIRALSETDFVEDGPQLPEARSWQLHRQGIRILISDLLFPGEPGGLLGALSSVKRGPIVIAPGALSESRPDWQGHLEVRECENGLPRNVYFSEDMARKYETAYENHFEMWRRAAIRHGGRLYHIPCELEFREALMSLTEGGGPLALRT